MQNRKLGHLIVVIACVFSIALGTVAQKNKQKQTTAQGTKVSSPEPPLPRGNKMKAGSEQTAKASKVFGEIMGTPDKGIPSDLLNKAECVAVFPSVVKAGFIVGGKAGRGVASCRT